MCHYRLPYMAAALAQDSADDVTPPSNEQPPPPMSDMALQRQQAVDELVRHLPLATIT